MTTKEMQRIFVGLIGLVILLASAWAQAELSLEQRAGLIEARASKLRQQLLTQSTPPAEIDKDVQQTLRTAEDFWRGGQSYQALLTLSQLQKYAPIAELPFIKVQLLQAAIAQAEGNLELRNHHQAWALALAQAINRSGSGNSPATAYQLVLPSELDGWIISQSDTQSVAERRSFVQAGRPITALQMKARDGGERVAYFTVLGKSPVPASRTLPASSAERRASALQSAAQAPLAASP